MPCAHRTPHAATSRATPAQQRTAAHGNATHVGRVEQRVDGVQQRHVRPRHHARRLRGCARARACVQNGRAAMHCNALPRARVQARGRTAAIAGDAGGYDGAGTTIALSDENTCQPRRAAP
jgi:hypothetical protein